MMLSDAPDIQTGSGPFSLRLAPNAMYGFVEVYLKTSGPGIQGKHFFIKMIEVKESFLRNR
jgi:hypothetical protein